MRRNSDADSKMKKRYLPKKRQGRTRAPFGNGKGGAYVLRL